MANILHPLHCRWVLWTESGSKPAAEGLDTSSWVDHLKNLSTMATVEEFWGMYSHLRRPSSLTPGCSYYFFRQGVRPVWEDEGNRAGGRWIVHLTGRDEAERLDGTWEALLLSLVGEYADEGIGCTEDLVTGAVCSARRSAVKLAVWTRATEPSALVQALGTRLRAILEISPQSKLEFVPHEADAKRVLYAA